MKNTKGMFFTLATLALLSLLLFSYELYGIVKERDAISKRISSMNTYVFSLEEDLPRKLYISGFRILFILEKRIVESGAYASNVSSKFQEAFFNRTIGGYLDASEVTLMQGITLEDIEEEINDDASKLNLEVKFGNPSISISQTDPWHVEVTLTTQLSIEDKSGLASWNQSAVLKGYVPIETFDDPIYIIKTQGRISQKMIATPYTNFTSGSNITNLTNHLNGRFYKASIEAPSFLKRLEGSFSADAQGIESLVYLPDLTAQGISTLDKSIVDHVYFSSSNPASSHILGMPSWFKIDADHLDDYNVTGLVG